MYFIAFGRLLPDMSELVNPKLLLDLPATPGSFHNGGVVICKIGPSPE
jgi:hypothetical protein